MAESRDASALMLSDGEEEDTIITSDVEMTFTPFLDVMMVLPSLYSPTTHFDDASVHARCQ